MSTVEENKEVVRSILEEVMNDGNYDNVQELIHPDWIYSVQQIDFKGPEGFKENSIMWRTAFPDLKRTILEIIAEGDMVSILTEFDGTFNGKLLDLEGTGNHVTHTMAIFFKFKDGKAVDMIPIANMLDMYQQMGITPPN